MLSDVQEVIKHADPLQVFGYLCTWVGGVLINYVQKTKRDGLDWRKYWTNNPFSTVASIFVSIGIFVNLISSGETNHITYFSVAFMAENLINNGANRAKPDSDPEPNKPDNQ